MIKVSISVKEFIPIFVSGLRIFVSGLRIFVSGLRIFFSGLNIFVSGLPNPPIGVFSFSTDLDVSDQIETLFETGIFSKFLWCRLGDTLDPPLEY